MSEPLSGRKPTSTATPRRRHLPTELQSEHPLGPKSSSQLVESLRRRILSGELQEGAALPVERALAAETGMSRTAVREALRTLEAEGLTHTRPGRGGGSFVRRPDMLTMEHSLGVFIAGRQVHIHSLLEVRRALEPVGAELAAMHRTPEDLEQIEQLFSRHEQAVGDLPAFLRANVDWHIAVVKAGHNDLLHALILALSSAILKGTELDDFASEAVRLGTIRAHRSVVDAIRKRDASRARRSMERHLTAYQDEVSRHPELDQLTLDSGIPEPAPRNGLSRPDT